MTPIEGRAATRRRSSIARWCKHKQKLGSQVSHVDQSELSEVGSQGVATGAPRSTQQTQKTYPGRDHSGIEVGTSVQRALVLQANTEDSPTLDGTLERKSDIAASQGRAKINATTRKKWTHACGEADTTECTSCTQADRNGVPSPYATKKSSHSPVARLLIKLIKSGSVNTVEGRLRPRVNSWLPLRIGDG